jgi:maltose alpha-D-glucosyltransferase/alpha-amylase
MTNFHPERTIYYLAIPEAEMHTNGILCGTIAALSEHEGGNMGHLWYKSAVLYELHIKTFFDSNGDGIGDFNGLTQKLDYLKHLGVTCIWLLPFYPSPLRDDGYDIADYYNVHPNYGTREDFKRFLDEAHARDLKVIADLVMNHTSDQHPWFQAARNDPKSPYHDYYVWSDTKEKYQGARIIFIDTEPSNWTWDDKAGQYYWHRFFSHQPDLNFDNPAVQDEMLKIADYWMGMGLDGFRADAVPYLFEREGTNCENLPETHAFLKKLRAWMDQNYPDKILLAEANQWPVDVRPYFGDGDEFHMAFNFPVMPRLYMAIGKEDRTPIVDIMSRIPPIPENCQWCTFLRNHDELTLEMVTEEERAYMYATYAKNPRMKLNLGIRRRLTPLMENSRPRVELLTALLFSLPGTPIVYYGDEIGMGDNIELDDRNGVRTPMQWNAGQNAGFSQADPTRLYAPVIADSVYGYQTVNVAAQEKSPDSLLNWMKTLIERRKQTDVFGEGSLTFLTPENVKVLAFIRSWQDESVLCINNLSASSQDVALDLRDYAGKTPQDMAGEATFPTIADSAYRVTLKPYGFYWLRLRS